MSHSNVKTVVGRNKSEKFYNIIIIIKRFTHAHEDNMGDSDILVALSGIYLTEDFRRKQTSDITTQSGRAERAAHFAAYLS